MSATLIADRYILERRLGHGGMSTVHLAFDERLERFVAIKLLAEHLAADEAFVARFEREARAAARLIHPNVVQVFDSGHDRASDRHFIVMEYVDGQSCAELLRDHGRLPVATTLDLIGQACQGLDYAHRNGVVHRDVKPGNLLRSSEGVLKLADFGIAKAAEQSSITQIGSVLGTAAYLAPEQGRGEEAGPAADLYALGVVTYQLLSGRLPYEADSLTELALRQQREAPQRLDVLNPDVPPELAAAVARALALEPAARYPDALAMADALRGGALGVAPTAATRAHGRDHAPTASTRIGPGGAAPATAHTRLAASSPDHTRVAPVAPVAARAGAPARRRRPQPSAAPAPAPAAPPASTRRRRAEPAPVARRPRRRPRPLRFLFRIVSTLLLVVLLAAVGGAVLVVADRQVREDARHWATQATRDIGDEIQRLIDNATN